jgi:hypothetical protein
MGSEGGTATIEGNDLWPLSAYFVEKLNNRKTVSEFQKIVPEKAILATWPAICILRGKYSAEVLDLHR